MTNTANRICSTVADVIAEWGVKDAVCSPGSRNAPLLMAFSASTIDCHVVVDERSAAFMALGLAEVSRRPVALVCTSGTALLNYAPAVAEAYYKGIPLIVISADRPIQWIDQDDSQTISQYEALRRFVKQSYDISAHPDADDEDLWYAGRVANDALITASSRRKGPVHLNIRISPPIGAVVRESDSHGRHIELMECDGRLNRRQIDILAQESAGKRILLICGFMQPDDSLNRSVAAMQRLGNVKVMCETISNLHLDGYPQAVDLLLSAMTEKELDLLAPELVITIGGALISRKIKEYLRHISSTGRCRHWTIGYSHNTIDCFRMLSRRIEADPAITLRALAAALKSRQSDTEGSGYAAIWQKHLANALESHRKFIAAAPWSELKALDMVFAAIPQQANLFLSNGTSIRYAQLSTHPLPHASYCNRGVSGIDGSTSTAVGGAMAYDGMTVLVTGDMSAAYDVGAFSLRQLPPRMRIIVINNSGGGIFRFIDATRDLPIREDFLCSPPVFPLQKIATAYGLDYFKASDIKSLETVLPEFLSQESMKDAVRPAVLEIVTDAETGAGLLRKYMKRHNSEP